MVYGRNILKLLKIMLDNIFFIFILLRFNLIDCLMSNLFLKLYTTALFQKNHKPTSGISHRWSSNLWLCIRSSKLRKSWAWIFLLELKSKTIFYLATEIASATKNFSTNNARLRNLLLWSKFRISPLEFLNFTKGWKVRRDLW